MSQTTPFLVAGALILYVPGLLLLLVCRVRSPRVLFGVAPIATIGLLQLAGLLSTVTPLHIRGSSAVVSVLLAGTLVVLDRRAGPDGAVVGAARRVVTAVRGAPLTSAVGGALLVGAVYLATTTWLTGFDGVGTPPQEHDTVTHTLLTAYIARTGEASPFDVAPVDLATGGWVRFYPAGLHTYAALLAQLRGDAVAGLNGATLLLLAVAGPVTLAAAAAGIEPRRTRPAFAALAALLAVGLYRPYLQLMHDAGILPFAIGLAMAPALAICLLTLRRGDRPMALATAIVALALFTLHPSIAFISAIVAAVVLLVCVLQGPGRAWLADRLGVLGLTALAAVILVVPWALASVSVAGSVADYPETPPSQPVGEVSRWIGGFFYGGFFDTANEHFQLGFAVVFWIGVVGCLTSRRLWPLLAAWLSWAVAALLYGSGHAELPGLAQLGSLFFNSWVRIMSVSGVIAPVVAAIGIAALVDRLAGVLDRRGVAADDVPDRPHRGAALAAGVAALVAVAHLVGAGAGYHDTNTRAVAERYGDPEFIRVSPEERAAFAFLRSQPDVGRVLNNGNDGSTFLYVYEGIPVVNTYPLGMVEARHGIYLMQHMNDLERDPAVACLLRRWDITHVVVSVSSPRIGARGAPDGWYPRQLFDYAPGFFDLEDVAGLTVAFANPDVAVFRIDPRVRETADLSACTADPADPLPDDSDG